LKKTLPLAAPLCAALLCAAVLGLGGCNSHKDLMAFLGKWKGGFDVTSVRGANASSLDIKRDTLRGFIQVYETNRSYKMELNGEQETIEINGTWTIKGNHITLRPTMLDIDDKGGEQQRDPNKKYIAAMLVRAAYGQPLVLVESRDKKSLTGLEMSVGDLVGTHRYVKDSF